MLRINSHSPTRDDLKQVWKDFGVHNSNELEDKLMADDKWHFAKCHKCGCKYDLLYCDYTSEGNPICVECHCE